MLVAHEVAGTAAVWVSVETGRVRYGFLFSKCICDFARSRVRSRRFLREETTTAASFTRRTSDRGGCATRCAGKLRRGRTFVRDAPLRFAHVVHLAEGRSADER